MNAKSRLALSVLLCSMATASQIKPEGDEPSAQDSAVEESAQTAVKVEDVVDDVVDHKLNTPNIERSTTKFVTDLTSMFAAFGGFVASKKMLPAFLGASGQTMDDKALKNIETPVAVIASLICMRLAKSGIKILLKTMDWDPRDLAVANQLLSAVRSGKTLTSDYNSMRELLTQIIPEAGLMEPTKNSKSLSNHEKIELSQRIRSCIRAFRKTKQKN